MAQVLIAANQIDVTGLDQPAGAAPDVADGVEFVSDTSAILAVNNASGRAVTATVVTPGQVAGGIGIEDPTVVVPASTLTYIRVPAAAANDPATGLSQVTFSAVASVTCYLLT